MKITIEELILTVMGVVILIFVWLLINLKKHKEYIILYLSIFSVIILICLNVFIIYNSFFYGRILIDSYSLNSLVLIYLYCILLACEFILLFFIKLKCRLFKDVNERGNKLNRVLN